MLHGSNRSSTASSANTFRFPERSMPWRCGLNIADEVATLVRPRWRVLKALERASGPPPADIITTPIASRTETDSSTLELELPASLPSILNQTGRPQDMDPPMQRLPVIPDGEAESPNISPRIGSDFPEVPDRAYEQITDDEPCVNASSTQPAPAEEHVPTTLPASLSTDGQQSFNMTRLQLPPLPTQDYIPPSLPAPFRVLSPLGGWHRTLTSWVKNMNKLSRLLDRLQKSVSSESAPPEYRPQLSRQVVMLCATFKTQQERCIEVLQLSEEFTSRYLLDISDEIQHQASVLDMLGKRLAMAKTLRRQVMDLRRRYKSGTVAIMKNVRAKALPQPLPRDLDLFSEVDSVLTQIRRCFKESEKFWKEEICCAVKAFEMGRVDPRDIGHSGWKSFHASLKQTVESWNSVPASRDSQASLNNHPSDSTGPDIGAIAFSLSAAMGSMRKLLNRVHSSASLLDSLEHTSRSGQSLVLQVSLAFSGDRDRCHSFLRHCAKYAEMGVFCALPTSRPASPHLGISHDLRQRAMRSRFETAAVSESAKSALNAQGPRKFKTVHRQAVSLEQKTIYELNALVDNLLSWVAVTDGPTDDERSDVVTLKQLRELSHAWAKARNSVRTALDTLTNEGPSARNTLLPTTPTPQPDLRRGDG